MSLYGGGGGSSGSGGAGPMSIQIVVLERGFYGQMDPMAPRHVNGYREIQYYEFPPLVASLLSSR